MKKWKRTLNYNEFKSDLMEGNATRKLFGSAAVGCSMSIAGVGNLRAAGTLSFIIWAKSLGLEAGETPTPRE